MPPEACHNPSEAETLSELFHTGLTREAGAGKSSINRDFHIPNTLDMWDLENVKGFYDYGIERGLTTPEDFRLTIAKRQEAAKALVNGGMSQRQAAKAVGVSHTQLQRDVARDVPESGTKGATTTRALLAQSALGSPARPCGPRPCARDPAAPTPPPL